MPRWAKVVVDPRAPTAGELERELGHRMKRSLLSFFVLVGVALVLRCGSRVLERADVELHVLVPFVERHPRSVADVGRGVLRGDAEHRARLRPVAVTVGDAAALGSFYDATRRRGRFFGFLLRSDLLGRCTLESFFDGFLPLCDMFFISFGIHLFIFEEETERYSFIVACRSDLIF